MHPQLCEGERGQICRCFVSSWAGLEGSVLIYRYSLVSKLRWSEVPPTQHPLLCWKYNCHLFFQSYISCLWHSCCCNLCAGLQSPTAVQSAVTSLLKAPANLGCRDVPTLSAGCLWLPHNTQALVYPFAKTCQLQVKLTLMILHCWQSRGTLLGCWNMLSQGRSWRMAARLSQGLEFTAWTRAEGATQQSSLLKASLSSPQ